MPPGPTPKHRRCGPSQPEAAPWGCIVMLNQALKGRTTPSLPKAPKVRPVTAQGNALGLHRYVEPSPVRAHHPAPSQSTEGAARNSPGQRPGGRIVMLNQAL